MTSPDAALRTKMLFYNLLAIHNIYSLGDRASDLATVQIVILVVVFTIDDIVDTRSIIVFVDDVTDGRNIIVIIVAIRNIDNLVGLYAGIDVFPLVVGQTGTGR